MIDTHVSLEDVNKRSMLNMGRHLGIEFTEIQQDYVVARMPVHEGTRQPLGFLNGGASAALAEIVGSTAGYLSVDRRKYYCLGLSISSNHVRGISEGWVYATAMPVHTGSRTHVWRIENRDEQGNLLTWSTLTLAVLELTDAMREKYNDLFFPVDKV